MIHTKETEPTVDPQLYFPRLQRSSQSGNIFLMRNPTVGIAVTGSHCGDEFPSLIQRHMREFGGELTLSNRDVTS